MARLSELLKLLKFDLLVYIYSFFNIAVANMLN